MAVKKSKKKNEEPVQNATIIQRTVLAKSVGIASKAVNQNTSLPLLTNLLVECDDGESSVTATDLEILVRSHFTSKGVPFRTCIPANTFQRYVDSINADNVEIRVNDEDQSITVVADTSTSTIKCISAEDFPDVPVVEDPQISIPVSQFKYMVNRVAFASSNDENRGPLVGVYMEVSTTEDGDKKFIMFAADGNRASYEETTGIISNNDQDFSAIIKGVTLETIAKRLLPDDGIMEVEVRGNKILLHCDEVDIVSQLIDGRFPSHQMLKKSVEERSTTMKVNTLDFLRACKQLKVFASETGATKMEIQDMVTHYSTMKHEKGESNVIIFAEKEGEDLLIGINTFLLYEFLEIVNTPQVVISFNGPKKPILLKMEDTEEFYHIIMPLYVPAAEG